MGTLFEVPETLKPFIDRHVCVRHIVEYVLIYLDLVNQTKFSRRRLWIEVDKVWERIRSMEDLTSFIRQRSNYFQCPCDLHFPRWCIPHLTFTRPGVVVGVANTCLAKSSSLVHSFAFVPFLFEQILYIICIYAYDWRGNQVANVADAY